MDNGGDILRLCRLCLVKDDVNIPIFEEQGDIRQIFLKISSCLPVKVSREDKLPKKICDGCSYKLDMLYEFWNTTANAEKQLLSWLGEAGMNAKMADGTISAVAQQIKPVETFVKQEAIDPSDIHTEDDDDKSYMFQQKFAVEEAGPSATVTSNEEEPPPKRARRTAAVKAQIAMDPESDDDDDSGEPMTKVEDESEESEGDDHEPPFVDVPSTSADDQPGPSGVGKDGVEAPNILCYLLNSRNCPECGKQFKSEHLLHKHKLYMHKEKMFACDICDKKFTLLHMMNYHKRLKHFKEYTCHCDFCGRTLENKFALRRHINRVHLQRYDHGCRDCEKVFGTKSAADKHYQVVHEGKTIEYTCQFCNKTYRNDTSFKEHVQSHDPDFGKTKLHCQVCSRQFIKRTALRAHMNVKHKNREEVHICDICGKSLSSQSSLANHRRAHTGERPFSCQFCEKSFTSKPLLRIHVRVHTKEKPYSCEVCTKSFSQRATLTIHMRYHSGERPYECRVCQKKFVSNTVLKNHKCTINRIH